MHIPDDFSTKLMDALRPREREILGLHCFDDFDVPEIAEMLGSKPDSISGHISKGLASVANVLGVSVQQAKWLIESLGELHQEKLPMQPLRLDHGEDAVTLMIRPHRQVVGGVVREGKEATDITAFYIAGISGRAVSVEEARRWFGKSAISLSHQLRRDVLHIKGIKPRENFDQEALGYFFGVGMGLRELYYERDFPPAPLVPDEYGMVDIMTHEPPPLEIHPRHRPRLLPKKWKPQVFDDGGDPASCEGELALDIETVVRSKRT